MCKITFIFSLSMIGVAIKLYISMKSVDFYLIMA